MGKKTKIWLVIATLFVISGLILFAVGMEALGWEFGKLSTAKYETNSHEIREEFCNIAVETDTADIRFAVAEDGKCTVVCYELENAKHAVAVQDDTLVITVVNEIQWYEYIGITVGTPKVTVYLPKTEYNSLRIQESTGDVEIPKDFLFENMGISTSTGAVENYASVLERMKIESSTGDIRVENVSADMLDLSVSTGEVVADSITCHGDIQIRVTTGRTKLTDVACKNITSWGDTGDIMLKDVIASEMVSVERGTGDVKFQDCDAGEIRIETDTGDVTGTLLSEKIFITETDTGSVDVPKTTTGGRCEITTGTGDIRIEIQR